MSKAVISGSETIFEREQLFKVLPYADEKLESKICYPKGFRIRSVAEQVEELLKYLPNLDFSHAEKLAAACDMPEKAEAPAVIPDPLRVDEAGYRAALEKVLGLIAGTRQFRNWREGALTKDHLRLVDKTSAAHAKLRESPGDAWVFPFQFGLLHRAESVRHARVRFVEKEFGLGPYEVAILLLTHPDRIASLDQLYIDCAGCEYDPSGAGGSSVCLSFDWDYCGKCLRLNYYYINCPIQGWGAASGFLPPTFA